MRRTTRTERTWAAELPLGATDVRICPGVCEPWEENLAGSLVVDRSGLKATFLKSGAPLDPGTYTVVLRSAANAFQDAAGGLLRGLDNGATAGDFTTTIVVPARIVGAVIVGVPDFVRGPGQVVNVPASAQGLPLTVSDGTNVKTIEFQLGYDPAYLQISGIDKAAFLPGTASVSMVELAPGLLKVVLTSPTALGAGLKTFATLRASVPSTAANVIYLHKQILDIHDLVVTDGQVGPTHQIAALDDDGLQVVAYFGDVSGNGRINAADVSLLGRRAAGLDMGFVKVPLADPVLFGDVSGNARINAGDVSFLGQAAAGLTVAQLPAVPPGLITQAVLGPDPQLSLPTNLTASAGGSVTIPVHLDSVINLPSPNRLFGSTLVIAYPATDLTFDSVTAGAFITNRPGWQVQTVNSSVPGQLTVIITTTTAAGGAFSEDLINIKFLVKADATAGAKRINLKEKNSTGQRTELNDESDGILELIPAPSDADTDTIDGIITIGSSSNSNPTISDLVNQTTDEDVTKGPLSFTVGDVETAPAELTVTATSSNTTLIPTANLTLSGSGANRTLTLQPASNQSGTSVITVTVADAANATTSDTFTLTVTAVNDVPTISDLVDQTTVKNIAKGPLSFTIGDVETAAADLVVTATSSNTTLVPNANLTLGGSGANRTLTLQPAPNQSGTAVITVTVADAANATTSDTFTLTVTAVNDAPTISDLVDQTTDEDVTKGPLSFTVGDVETAPADLTITATSSNTTLVPNANLTLGGSGANRTLTLPPASNQSGTSVITVTVADAANATTSDTFTLTVTAVNDVPTISDIVDQTTTKNVTKGPLNFTVGDVETAAADLVVTATSSNTTLVPNANLTLGGSGASRTLMLLPATDQTGTTVITVTVQDGNGATASDSFTLTVSEPGSNRLRWELGGAVSERVRGSFIGVLCVTDPGDSTKCSNQDFGYEWQSADPRISVDSVWVHLSFEDPEAYLDIARDGTSMPLEVTLVDPTGTFETIVETVVIDVIANPWPWQNPIEPLDPDRDNVIAPIDVLLIINEINARIYVDSLGELPWVRPSFESFLDVTGDQHATPIDALLIINELNAPPLGEGERATQPPAANAGMQPRPTNRLNDTADRRVAAMLTAVGWLNRQGRATGLEGAREPALSESLFRVQGMAGQDSVWDEDPLTGVALAAIVPIARTHEAHAPAYPGETEIDELLDILAADVEAAISTGRLRRGGG